MRCPANYLLVRIDKAYQDQINLSGGLTLYQDVKFNPSFHVTITGEIVSLPAKVTNTPGCDRRSIDLSGVKPGMEAVFSYLTVFDQVEWDDRDDVFEEDYNPNPQLTVWGNKKGFKLLRYYRLQDDKYDVAALDSDGKEYSGGRKITEKEVDGWLSKFKFTKTDGSSFRNLVEYNGEQLWKVDVNHLYAVKEKEGNRLTMTGGYVFLEPVKEEIKYKGAIILLNPIKVENEATARIIAIGDARRGRPKIDAQEGDIVVYDRRFAQEYTAWGRPVLLLKQDRLLAKVQ